MISLVLTIAIIFFVLFPLTLWGFNPLLVSIAIAGVISLLVFRIIGMNVGRDIMETMSNTLILAYTGAALPLLLLFIAGGFPLTKVINMEMVAEEIARALAGSIGLVLCIPATALAAAAMYARHSRHKTQTHGLPRHHTVRGLPEGWLKR